MPDLELVEKVLEAEIVLGTDTVVDSAARDPDSYGAGFSAWYVAGRRKALEVLRD